MSVKEPLIFYNQDEFCVEDDCRASTIEFEDWDTPEKISTVLWFNSSLAGEFELSDEAKSDLHRAATRSFSKLCSSAKAVLTPMEERILTLEAIVLTQEMEMQQDESQLWPYLFSALNYDESESKVSYQQLYNRCREMLERTVSRHNRIFADFGEGKKYYNTLNIHALAPAWGIDNLFSILYSFYSKNLEFHYEPHDSAFELFVKNITKRWESKNEKDEDLKLRSNALSSSLKMLFIHRPGFMAAVCDALTEHLDSLLKGDSEQFDKQNRWNVLLLEWYGKKAAYEQEQMLSKRKKASKERVITKKDDIQPAYSLISDEVYISVPRLRLPEITVRPSAELLQNGTVIKRMNLSVYGDDLCLTTREFEFPISGNGNVNWYAPLNFAVRILCGDNEVYQSGTSLFRNYILFSERGIEARSLRHKRSTIYALANYKANVDFSDDSDITQLGAVGQLFRINLAEIKNFFIDGTDILTQGKNSSDAFYYLSESNEKQTYIISNKIEYDVYESAPELNIELPHNESAKDYFLFIDDTRHSLYEYGENKSRFAMSLPETPKFFHNAELRKFSDNKTVFSIHYIVLPDFSFEFDKPYYPNKFCEGTLKVQHTGNKKTIKFELSENQTCIDFELWNNALCRVQVPKLNVILSGSNAFSLPSQVWHDEFELDAFLRIELPSGCHASLFLGSKAVSMQGRHYEIGNYIHSKASWMAPELPLGIVVRDGSSEVHQEFLTSVVFEEKFSDSPVKAYDSNSDGQIKHAIDWDPRGLFIGPEDSEFRVDLKISEKETWNFRETLKKGKIETDFPCPEGYYNYKIYLRGKEGLFTKTEDKLLLEDELLIGDPAISRFYDKEIRLRRVSYWDADSCEKKISPIKDGDAILTGMYYMGLSIPDGKEDCYPEYEAVLSYERADGFYQHLCSNAFSYDREWTNPVTIWLVGDSSVLIRARSGDPLLVNSKHPHNISTVRIVDSYSKLSKADQYKYINDADSFEYEVVPRKKR